MTVPKNIEEHIAKAMQEQYEGRRKPTRILSCDLLIADESVSPARGTSAFADFENLLGTIGLTFAGKKTVDAPKKQEFESLIKTSGLQSTIEPGGSSANTLVTLSKFLGSTKVAVDFIGACGPNHPYDPKHPDSKIRAGLKDAGINLVTDDIPDAVSAHSFVINDPGNDRAIATFPGNADKVLKASMVTDELVAKNDVLLVQGSLWNKLDETPPVERGFASADQLGVADMLMKKRWEMGKELWLAMPTQADFSRKKKDGAGKEIPLTVHEQEEQHNNKARHFRKLIKTANVVLGNGEEISRVYTYPIERFEIDTIVKAALTEAGQNEEQIKAALKDRSKLPEILGDKFAALNGKYDLVNNSVQVDEALKRLQHDFGENMLEVKSEQSNLKEGETRWTGSKSQVAFVSLGKEGAVIVTKDGVGQTIPVATFEGEIKSKLGAGDTAFAGFLAAYLEKQKQPDLSYDDCARLGMWMAREKLQVGGARLPDPFAAISTAFDKAIGADAFQNDEEKTFVNKIRHAVGLDRERAGSYLEWSQRLGASYPSTSSRERLPSH